MAPGILLYDGHCRLCVAGSRRLWQLARPGAIERRDFQEPGVLAAFPGLSHERCMQAMQLVAADGHIYSGAEAVAHALLTRGPLCAWAYLYYAPGLRQLTDWAYEWVARNRYLFLGKSAELCGKACVAHVPGRHAS